MVFSLEQHGFVKIGRFAAINNEHGIVCASRVSGGIDRVMGELCTIGPGTVSCTS